MTLTTIVLVAIYLVFVFTLYYRPLITVLESLVALVLAIVVSTIFFQKALDVVSVFGIRENIYTPSLILILTITIVWALVFTLLSLLLNVGHVTKSYKSKYWSIFLSVFFTVAVGAVACLTVAPFIQNMGTQKEIEDCYLCKVVGSTSADIGPLDGNLSKISPDVYMPENGQKAIHLGDDFSQAVFNSSKSSRALELVNSLRAKNSREPLVYSEDLKDLALSYGREISQTKYFSHTSEDGRTDKERAEEIGISYNYLGENLAIAPTLERAQEALENSESHYKNIISPLFSKAGIAVFDLDNGFIMLVQEFSS